MRKVVEYQIGVDVLGFPLFMKHEIIEGTNQQGFIKKPKKWLRVLQTIVKQF
ncbi:hypothetical protein QT970_02380 [Microcoleus sp. herbarium8]